MLYGLQDGGLCNLMENNAAGLVLGEFKSLRKVPGYGFSLAVFIGGKPYGGRCICKLPQVCHHLLFIGGDDILRLEAVLNVYTKLMFFKVPDMAD